MITKRCTTLVPVLGVLLAAPAAAEPAWTPLFDGRTLAGFRAPPGAFAVRDGAVVVAQDGPGLLCTERVFGDFVLEYEVQGPPGLGAGVVLRASTSGAGGRATGYQPAIAPDLLRAGAWNAVRVEARGPSLGVSIGGRSAWSVEGATGLVGTLCLARPDGGDAASWRKLRVQDHGRRAWLPIFSGTDARGLRPAGGGQWMADRGILIGTIDAGAPESGLLIAEAPVSDFTARLEYRLTSGNAGLYLRARKAETPAGAAGLQVDLDAREGAGGLHETGGRGWLIRGMPTATAGGDGWHEVIASAQDKRVAVHLDGARVALLADAPGPTDGLLALELGGGQAARLEVRRFERLSPVIPPPVPGFPVGRCVRVVGTEAPEEAESAGFEYLELALQDMLALPDDAFEREVTRLRGLRIRAVSGYGFLPADLKVVGPDVDLARLDAALEDGLGRAARLGLQMVVYGNLLGSSRLAPDGFPRDKAWKQLVDFGRRAARAAAKHRITVLVEPLPSRQTNMVNTVAQGLALVREVGHPGLRLLVDYGYTLEEKEDLAILHQAARYIRQVEIQNPNGRVYVRSPEEADYAGFFRALARGGYRGGFSIHGKPDVFLADAPRAIATLRQVAAAELARRKPGS